MPVYCTGVPMYCTSVPVCVPVPHVNVVPAGGRAASAGSWLRRQNTIALRDNIHELLALWKPMSTKCQRVFIAATKRTISTLYCEALQKGVLDLGCACFVSMCLTCGHSHGIDSYMLLLRVYVRVYA